MPASEKYECTLDKDSVKKAQKELGEDPKERESAVASLRQWIEQNSAWLKSPTGNCLPCSLLQAKPSYGHCNACIFRLIYLCDFCFSTHSTVFHLWRPAL